MKRLTYKEAKSKWSGLDYLIIGHKQDGYNQAIDDHIAEAGKMIDNKVMLQRAYGWLRSHYPNVEVLHLQVEVMASYMARFAQEQIKSLKEEPR